MGPMIRDQEWFPYAVAAATAVAVAVASGFSVCGWAAHVQVGQILARAAPKAS